MHIAHNHVAGVNAEVVVLDAYSVTGGCLAGNCKVALFYLQGFFKRDYAGYIKDDGKRTFTFFDGVTQ